MERLSTGISGLDRLLKGGFAFRKINLVYGEASTGKTVLSMQSALAAAASGLKVFFVDADLSFSVQRLESLDRGKELAENIVVFQPEEFREQIRIRECLLEKMDGREVTGPRALFRIGDAGIEDV